MSELLQFIKSDPEVSVILTIIICIFLFAVIEKIVDTIKEK